MSESVALLNHKFDKNISSMRWWRWV